MADKNKLSLFDEDDSLSSDDEAELEHQLRPRPEYEGKKGHELMKKQVRIVDSRFKLDERFHEESSADEEDDEDDDDDDDDKAPIKAEQEQDGDSIADVSLVEEKKRSLAILSSIVGEQAVKKRKTHVEFKPVERYDPSAADHAKLEIKTKREEVKEKKKKSPSKKAESKSTNGDKSIETESQAPAEVSGERFVKADLETLGSIFKSKETKPAFTLFGGICATDEDTDDDDDDTTTVVPAKKVDVSARISKNFGGDLESDGGEKPVKAVKVKDKKSTVTSLSKNSFFFSENDPRLEAGLDFFFRNKPVEELREQWLERRPVIVEDFRQARKAALRRVKSASIANRKNFSKSNKNRQNRNKT